MLDLFLTLEGIWDLCDTGNIAEKTSHNDFYGDLYASHFAKEENCVLTISASNLVHDSISYTYASKRISTTREFLVDKFNLFFPAGSSSSSGSSSNSSSCNSTIFGSVISLDASAGSCSLLVIGPLPGQRVSDHSGTRHSFCKQHISYHIFVCGCALLITQYYNMSAMMCLTSWCVCVSPGSLLPIPCWQVIEKYTLEADRGDKDKGEGKGEGMQLCVRYFISSIEVPAHAHPIII